ncbi:hypothetical protein M758_3G066800 [Ceratodon purpureus]|nr:hypothetical protein M758_3G066800 [Ceratodon purpureus]
MEVFQASRDRATFQYRPEYNDEYQQWKRIPAIFCTPKRNIEFSKDKFIDTTMYTTHFADLSKAQEPGTKFVPKHHFQTYDIAATDPKLRALIKDDSYHRWGENEAGRSPKAHWVWRNLRRETFGGHTRLYKGPAVKPHPPNWKDRFVRERR